MIKKAISILMTFIYCTFLLGNTAFAGSTTCSEDEKKPRPPECEQKDCESKNHHYVQKAFLVALLCAMGIDVDIRFHSYYPSPYNQFTVSKIDSFYLRNSQLFNKQTQTRLIINSLKKQKSGIDFNASLSAMGAVIHSVKINNCILLQNTIHKIGKRALKLIYERKPKKVGYNGLTKAINLNEDALFKQEVTNIFEDVINNKNDDINPLSFFTLYSEFNFKKLDSIQNSNHIDYIKKYPEKSCDLAIYYEKAFFIGILSLFDIDTEIIMHRDHPLDFMTLNKIKNIPIQSKDHQKSYLESTIRCIESILPPEKIKIEYQKVSYSIPTKVIINNNIILYENEIFDLGQKFYNSIWENITTNPSLICNKIIKSTTFPILSEFIHTNQVPIFKEIMQNLLKEYVRK